MHADSSPPPPTCVPLGTGRMAERTTAYPWQDTPLGDMAGWPQSLRTTLSLMLASRFPMCLCWGPELTLFYNDAYAPILRERDDRALGMPLRVIWSDVWTDIEAFVEQAMSGDATWVEDAHLVMHRNGVDEDTWWTFSYTPVRDERGAVAGFLNITAEQTQKVLTERRLSAESERLARMFHQAPSFMALLQGPEHRIEFANPGYLRLIGDRDAIGRTVAEVLPEAVEQGYVALLDGVRASGRAFTASGARFALQNGPDGPVEEHFLDFVYQPIVDGEHTVGIFVEGSDVTARTRADLALREREVQLQRLNADLERQVVERAQERSLIWQLTPDLLAVLNADGVLESTNPAWRRVLGWTEADIAAQAYPDLVHPDDLEATTAIFERLRRGYPILDFENRYRRRDGQYRVFSWVATPEGDKYYCRARDITEERAAADALALSQAQLRTLFETSYQLQAMCALDGTLVDANATLLAAMGARFEDVAGRAFWDTPWFASTPAMSERMRGMFERAAGGDGVRQEIALTTASGERSYDFSMRPIRDADGRIMAVVPEAIDLTERRQAEQALRQSQKLDAMGQLTGGVAHDFNNLLTPIVAALEAVDRETTTPERRQRVLAAARQSAERATTLVQRLLAFARRQPLQPVDVDIAKLIGGMADLISSTCEPRVRVELRLDDGLARAVADPNQLEMAILNLAVNARDAMPDGGVLRIAAQNAQAQADATDAGALAAGAYVVLSVTDTGHGMDEATRFHAIEPFFSTKGIGKGTGLGLSMVHGLASQLGGQLRIDSAPGHGTRIELWLPAHASAATTANEGVEMAVNEGYKGVALVVDDEDAVRMCAADGLEDIGYTVVEAASAEAALRLLDDGLAPDLLVTDHLMPGMTGTELARALRQRSPALPIIVVSGYTSIEDLDPGLVLLSKPFRQHDLAASVRAATAPKT